MGPIYWKLSHFFKKCYTQPKHIHTCGLEMSVFMESAHPILFFHVRLFVPHLWINVISIGTCSFNVLTKPRYIWQIIAFSFLYACLRLSYLFWFERKWLWEGTTYYSGSILNCIKRGKRWLQYIATRWPFFAAIS